MSHKFLLKASFHLSLNAIDQELSKTVEQQGCPHGGGKLHQADYPRSPFGLPASFRDSYDKRLSFCCSQCRRRTTPPSVRFFGRRWFPAPLFILISALKRGATEQRRAQVQRHLGIVVSTSTWKRWQQWWRDSFMTTAFWQQSKGYLVAMPEVKKTFVHKLLSVFQGLLEAKMQRLLTFLAPITAGALRAV